MVPSDSRRAFESRRAFQPAASSIPHAGRCIRGGGGTHCAQFNGRLDQAKRA